MLYWLQLTTNQACSQLFGLKYVLQLLEAQEMIFQMTPGLKVVKWIHLAVVFVDFAASCTNAHPNAICKWCQQPVFLRPVWLVSVYMASVYPLEYISHQTWPQTVLINSVCSTYSEIMIFGFGKVWCFIGCNLLPTRLAVNCLDWNTSYSCLMHRRWYFTWHLGSRWWNGSICQRCITTLPRTAPVRIWTRFGNGVSNRSYCHLLGLYVCIWLQYTF